MGHGARTAGSFFSACPSLELTRIQGWDAPFLHRDTFAAYLAGDGLQTRARWDNGADDVHVARPADMAPLADHVAWYQLPQAHRLAVTSPDLCRELCASMDDCLQWRAADGECSAGKALRLGTKTAAWTADEPANYTSGWMADRVQTLTDGWGDCREINWAVDS